MSVAQLKFWGVRGSYAAPFHTHLKVGGNTSCVEINTGDHILVCDAGTGIIPLGNRLMQQNTIRKTLILLTHYHWDHVCGLPFFIPAFNPDWEIDFFGPGNGEKDVEEYIAMQMQAPYFPVGTEAWLAKINYRAHKDSNSLQYGPMKIEYHNVHHPGLTYGYKIEINGKTIVYVSDNECNFIEKTIRQRENEFNNEERKLFDDMIHEEYQTGVEMFQNVDILIHDAQYDADDYAKKCGWGHSLYTDTVNMAIDVNAKTLYLFHHDPNYDDEKIENIHQHAKKIIQQKNSSLTCHIAREGMTIDI